MCKWSARRHEHRPPRTPRDIERDGQGARCARRHCPSSRAHPRRCPQHVRVIESARSGCMVGAVPPDQHDPGSSMVTVWQCEGPRPSRGEQEGPDRRPHQLVGRQGSRPSAGRCPIEIGLVHQHPAGRARRGIGEDLRLARTNIDQDVVMLACPRGKRGDEEAQDEQPAEGPPTRPGCGDPSGRRSPRRSARRQR